MKSTVLLLLTFTALCAHAQENDASFRKRTYIKVNPSTIINELDIYLERDLSVKTSIELGITGIYTDYPDYVFMRRVDIGQRKPGITTEQFVEGRGLGGRLGFKWYMIRSGAPSSARGTYFEPVLFYKKIFYPHHEETINNMVYREDGNKNVYGLQLLLGRQIRKDKFILDPYLGVGVRSKVYHYTDFLQDGNAVNPDKGRLVNVLPSIHIGIKVGLGF